MNNKPLSLSLIILVYNEERHLAACLDAIARQTEAPEQVIVVDNNSTDQSAVIAKKYAFVTVVHELKQGMIPARNTGFSVAKGDILARIDADAILSPDWIARIKQDFSGDPSVGGVSGLADTVFFFVPGHGTFWSKMYFLTNNAYFRLPILWGANMAIRREVWDKIKLQTCSDDTVVHEDLDIALLTSVSGWRIVQDKHATIKINGREYLTWPKLVEYKARRASTRQYHERQGSLLSKSDHRIPRWKTLPTLALIMIPYFIFSTASYFLHKAHFPIAKER